MKKGYKNRNIYANIKLILPDMTKSRQFWISCHLYAVFVSINTLSHKL